MADLRSLNRDEWSEKPYLIELQGGPADGNRVRVSSLVPAYRYPVPISTATLTLPSEESAYPCSGSSVAQYQDTGSVTDYGVHVFRFTRYE